jgi:phosphate starvation-inducible PhoH-like protein
MFLTRIGFNSKAVITGDITQVDLPRGARSGLRHAMEVLDGLNEISFNYFKSHDVVRHPVVARIVEAYERNDESERLKRIKKQEARELQATGQRPPSTKE